MDSLNTEPQTFCGLLEIKEIVIPKIEALVATASVIKIAKK